MKLAEQPKLPVLSMVMISCEPGWIPVACSGSGSEADTVGVRSSMARRVDTGNLVPYLRGRLALGRRGSDNSESGRRGRTST